MDKRTVHKYNIELMAKAERLNATTINGKAEMIDFDSPITLVCRADALDLLEILQSDWTINLHEPLDALRRFIEALPEAPAEKRA